MTTTNPAYIGDAVYAFFDGYGVELRLERHDARCVVYLEPKVLEGLMLFWSQHTQKQAQTDESAGH
jgi:hypothetical protein